MRVSTRNARQYVDARKAFTTYGSLRGEVDPWIGSGRLSGPDLDRWRADSEDGISYAVVSYSTPIWWETRDGRTHRVSQKFSVTTSRHQGQTPRTA